MKMKTIVKGMICLAALAVAVPSFAQIVPNGLPSGEALPGAWTAAAAVFPTPEKWSASVSWAITNPSAGLYTYWYKVDHTGAGPLSPPTQPLKSSTVDIDPSYVQQLAGVYQFGSYEIVPPNLAGQSWGADPVSASDTAIRWSTQGGLFNTLTANESIYLWVRSTAPAVDLNLTLQDGTVAQTKVPGPGPVPEPMSMALVGVGLAAVGALRRKA
jgi:hypothetical protein